MTKINSKLRKPVSYISWQSDSFGDISVEAVKHMLKENDLNKICRFYKLMLTRDTHIYSQITKRSSQLAACEYEITGNNKKMTDFVRNWFNDKDGFSIIIQNLLSAIAYGFSVTDLVWDIKDGYFVPKPIFLPQTLFHSDENGLYLNQNKNKKLYIEDSDKFLVHLHSIHAGNIIDIGLLKNLIWIFTLKSYVSANYAKYVDILGVPPVIVQADSDNADDIVDQILLLRSAGAAAFPKDAIINLLEGKASGNIFMDFIDYADSVIAQAVLGQTLTSNITKTGSYAAAKVHNNVRLEYLKLDAMLIENTLNGFIKTLCKFNFSESDTPKFKFGKLGFDDEKTKAETLSILANMGVNIPEEHVRDIFNIPGDKISANSRKLNEKSDTDFKTPPSIINSQSRTPDLPLDEIDKHTSDFAGNKAIFKDIEQTLVNIFKECNSYEEAQNRLIEAYPEIRLEILEKELAKAIANSEIYGNVDD